jgi:hypothetical protein
MNPEPRDVFLRRTDSTTTKESDFGNFTATTLQWRGGATSLALTESRATGKHADAYVHDVETVTVEQHDKCVVLTLKGEKLPTLRVHLFGLTVLDLTRAANAELTRLADEALDEALATMGGTQ